MRKLKWVAALALCGVLASCGSKTPESLIHSVIENDHVNIGPSQVPVVFSGGYDTDPIDKGRPVVLIASALGVPPEVFRQAFSQVHPAPAGTRPDPEEVHRNKTVLLKALRPYGVTNERLDEVSDYYRYNRSRGELWPTKPAVAYALFKNGIFKGFQIVDGGSGYSSPPTATLQYLNEVINADIELTFSKTFEKNGAISKIVYVKKNKR